MKLFLHSILASATVLLGAWFVIYNFYWKQTKQAIINETVATLSDSEYLENTILNIITKTKS